MLKTKDLINKLGTEYEEMIKKVNIPDFTKCIAEYSGIPVQDLKDSIIENYLCTWAHSKKHIFDLMGALKVDMPIHYVDENIDSCGIIKSFIKDYPMYYHWLEMFSDTQKNKIRLSDLSWHGRSALGEAFPDVKIEGMALTHFFKSYLNAPDELVTAIGRIWENNEVDANFTLSIDPVDIMLSSENPYNWVSCYRLEQVETSHADGCLAGVLDAGTIVTYIWDREGKLNLYHHYDLKCVRYKRVRMTIAVNSNFSAIHFNAIYPGRSNYSKDFSKLLREKVETYFANATNRVNLWAKNDWEMVTLRDVEREHTEYGYGEYESDYVYYIKEADEYPEFEIYNEVITCPCGCGEDYIGSDRDDDEYEYNGNGHINENFDMNRCWCEYEEEYMDCNGECGPDCSIWCRENMVCELDNDVRCEERSAYDAEEDGDFDPYDGNIVECNPERCKQCPLYKIHHSKNLFRTGRCVITNEVNGI